MKNHVMISIRLISGVVVQIWCSYSTVPLNVIITQMGSRHKKALIAESVRDSLHSWCKRVKERSKLSVTTRSTCSLESTVLDERDEITVASGTLSRCSSAGSLHQLDNNGEPAALPPVSPEHKLSSHIPELLSHSMTRDIENNDVDDIEECRSNADDDYIEEHEHHQPETLLDLFQKT